MKYIGLSVIVRTEQEFNVIKQFLSPEILYLNWAPQMAERETGVIIWAKKKTQSSSGSVGCAAYQRERGIRTVEFKDFFKL